MKIKKLIVFVLLCIVSIMQFNFVHFYNISNAAETNSGLSRKITVVQTDVQAISADFETEITSNKDKVNPGDEFEVTVSVKNLERAIYAMGGKVEFNKNALELVENGYAGYDSWKFSKNDYNPKSFKFVTDTSTAVSGETDIIKMTFSVKEDAEPQILVIKLSDVTGGTGEAINGILHAKDSEVEIEVVGKEEPPVEEDITSDVYDINKEEMTISKIPAGTTIAQFKSNVSTKQEMVFSDSEGNIIDDEEKILENGMKVKVGENLEFTVVVEKKEEPPVEKYIETEIYDMNKEEKEITKISVKTNVADFKKNFETNMELTITDSKGNALEDDAIVGTGMKLKAEDLELVLIVAGDIDGDGDVGIDDIAKVKLHYIEKEILTGIRLKAADADFDSKISINDVAQMKIIYIGKGV